VETKDGHDVGRGVGARVAQPELTPVAVPPSVPRRETLIKWLPGFFVLALCSMIVLVESRYVGDITIYAREVEAARMRMHEAILHNRAPDGGWAAAGGNGLNVRVATVYLAEATNRVTGLSLPRTYKLIDMVAFVAALLCLERFLAVWSGSAGRIAALLFIGAMLPMTYAFHFFQPWDRIGWLSWIVTLWALARDRFLVLAGALAVAVAIKYDAVVLPALYPLVWYGRRANRDVIVRTAVLFAVCFAIYLGLRWLLPGGFSPRDPMAHLARNMHILLALNVNHPFALGFGIPIVLAVIGWRGADRFVRAAALFALPLLAIFFVQTNFSEIRAQMGVLTLLMPAAVLGFQRLVSIDSSAPTAGMDRERIAGSAIGPKGTEARREGPACS
jgi:hypothetical protein